MRFGTLQLCDEHARQSATQTSPEMAPFYPAIDNENIRRALNHKSGGSVTSQYIISQIETLRPIFQAVADGYHQYYDPDWEGDMADEEDV